MRLKVKDLDIATGGPLVAVLNKKDAKKIDVHPLDRIKICRGKKLETAVVDIAETGKSVPEGRIGVYEEVLKSLGAKKNDAVTISFAKKPLALEFIKKKLDGGILNRKEIDQIVWDITHNKLSESELTYFVAACYMNVMTNRETIMLTKSIAEHGTIMKFNKHPVIDKHCIGGIPGNRTTMVLVPIVAAAGLTIPKTSSRSITSPAGTADTMEVVADVSLPVKEMKKVIRKTNGCVVWGGSLNLAPADDKIINVEKTLEIDAESQLLASIMAKKYSVSSTHILIDIPVGGGGKAKNRREALKLKEDFEKIGRRLGKKVRVMLTSGKEPVGNGVGPALEARDVLRVLKRDSNRPLDLERKCVSMAAEIFRMAGVKEGKAKALDLLDSGKAYKKMKEIIKAQKGKVFDPEKIKVGSCVFDVKAQKSGVIKSISNRSVARLARIAGAPDNKGSGVYLHCHTNSRVKRGDVIFTIYSESRYKLDYAKEVLSKAENPFTIK